LRLPDETLEGGRGHIWYQKKAAEGPFGGCLVIIIVFVYLFYHFLKLRRSGSENNSMSAEVSVLAMFEKKFSTANYTVLFDFLYNSNNVP